MRNGSLAVDGRRAAVYSMLAVVGARLVDGGGKMAG